MQLSVIIARNGVNRVKRIVGDLDDGFDGISHWMRFDEALA